MYTNLSKLLSFTEKRKKVSPHTVELHSLQSSEIDMYEITVEENSKSINVPISELNLGKDVLISSIVRDGKIILPKGHTKIDAHDILFILAQSSKIDGIIKSINNA